jgi:solute carrier family 25 phosphate transporter 23/24/25/41
MIQVNSSDRGISGSSRDIFSAGGIKAFWRGNTVAILNQGIYSGLKAFVVKEMKRAFGDKLHSGGFERALTGAASGAVAQTVLYPMDFLRTRIIVYPGQYTSFWQALAKVVREEGFTGLWTGLMPTFVGAIPYEGSQFWVYDGMRSVYSRQTGAETISPFVNSVLGGAAGVVSQTVAYPFELVRRLMMLTDDNGHKLYRSMGECFRKIWEKEGIPGFYKGLTFNAVRVIPFSMLQYTVYDETCKFFGWMKKTLNVRSLF